MGMVFLGRPRTGFAANAHAPGLAAIWPLLIPAAACVAGVLLAPLFFLDRFRAGAWRPPLAGELLDECLVAATAILPSFLAYRARWLAGCDSGYRLVAGSQKAACWPFCADMRNLGLRLPGKFGAIQYSEGSFFRTPGAPFQPSDGHCAARRAGERSFFKTVQPWPFGAGQGQGPADAAV